MEREAARAEEAGQCLLSLLVVETTAVLALALGLSGEAERAAAAFADAEARAEALPYPSGLARVRAFREALAPFPVGAEMRPGPEPLGSS
ncbi:hypothetical protein ACPB9E_11505 [Streptomyces exfoliatus]|uniref:hypothetical protein n=1 Tax=Streptomyces exfoliatus TaxID=1905 RepID=UPI003C2D0866